MAFSLFEYLVCCFRQFCLKGIANKRRGTSLFDFSSNLLFPRRRRLSSRQSLGISLLAFFLTFLVLIIKSSLYCGVLINQTELCISELWGGYYFKVVSFPPTVTASSLEWFSDEFILKRAHKCRFYFRIKSFCAWSIGSFNSPEIYEVYRCDRCGRA